MKNKNYTWIIKDANGEVVKKTSQEDLKDVKAIYWGKLEDVVKLLTVREFKQMATIEIYNNGYDKVNHRPITKEQVEKMLEEMN